VERDKPELSRLREYSASRLGSVHAGILAEAPVHPVLEKLAIAFWLDKAREYLGPDHPAIRAMFGARTSREIAADIVENSEIGDTAFRKRMWADPKQAQASNDPALVLVRLVDAAAREARTVYEREVSIPTGAAAEKIAGLRFTVLGQNQYPDANFTLRLSYGVVKGWDDPANGQIEPFTYMQGLWKRATAAYPFNLGAGGLAARASSPSICSTTSSRPTTSSVAIPVRPCSTGKGGLSDWPSTATFIQRGRLRVRSCPEPDGIFIEPGHCWRAAEHRWRDGAGRRTCKVSAVTGRTGHEHRVGLGQCAGHPWPFRHCRHCVGAVREPQAVPLEDRPWRDGHDVLRHPAPVLGAGAVPQFSIPAGTLSATASTG